MRRISFSLTTPQFRARTKDVTRRLGWRDLKSGVQLLGIEKGMGLKRGERQQPLGPIETVCVRRERLDAITPSDVRREGFPKASPADFVSMFCQHNRCLPETPVTRIEYRYVDAVAPAVKWAGGKARLLPQLERRLPADVANRRHVELFAGGAALFFSRRPERAVLADVCGPLAELYKALQHDPSEVLRSLRGLVRFHGEEHYYRVRARFNRNTGSRAQRAAMLLYLNRAGFNGLYRQNRAGQYNVPFGGGNGRGIYQPERLRDCGAALAHATILDTDFEASAGRAAVGAGDFVYLDPPYAPTCGQSFRGYVAGGFDHDDHMRLRDLVRRLDRAGAKVMISNADTLFVRDIYRGFKIETVSASRSISRDGNGRGPVRELVIRNYGGAAGR